MYFWDLSALHSATTIKPPLLLYAKAWGRLMNIELALNYSSYPVWFNVFEVNQQALFPQTIYTYDMASYLDNYAYQNPGNEHAKVVAYNQGNPQDRLQVTGSYVGQDYLGNSALILNCMDVSW